jgi:hypothetical protein
MIMDSFDARTIAHMEMALERACKTLPKSNDNYEARRYIANRILEYAEAGDHTFGGLTEAGHTGASELAKRPRRRREAARGSPFLWCRRRTGGI